MENQRERYTNTQKKKLEKLASTKKSLRRLDINKTVVNISKQRATKENVLKATIQKTILSTKTTYNVRFALRESRSQQHQESPLT
nr:unnamed protein product [Callosobruchus analis]